MAIVINANDGTISGISVGGLPDGTVDAGTLATDSVVTGKIADGTILPADMANGGNKVLQIVNVQSGTVNTGTTTMPIDNTIPQITEGVEYMTLDITPKNASNILIVESIFYGGTSVIGHLTSALFVGTTSDALAATSARLDVANGAITLPLVYKTTSGTTSTLTFRVRAGCNSSGTVTFNGFSGGQKFSSAVKSSITITEYEV
jgi:hypothetical protein